MKAVNIRTLVQIIVLAIGVSSCSGGSNKSQSTSTASSPRTTVDSSVTPGSSAASVPEMTCEEFDQLDQNARDEPIHRALGEAGPGWDQTPSSYSEALTAILNTCDDPLAGGDHDPTAHIVDVLKKWRNG